MAGVKEIKELLEGVKVLGIQTKKVLADGKVSLTDLPVLIEVFQNYQVLVDAVQGADQIPNEVKDLDGTEAQEVLAKVLEVANAIKAA